MREITVVDLNYIEFYIFMKFSKQNIKFEQLSHLSSLVVFLSVFYCQYSSYPLIADTSAAQQNGFSGFEELEHPLSFFGSIVGFLFKHD